MANAKIKKNKTKKKEKTFTPLLTPEQIAYFSLTLSDQVLNNFFFTMYVLPQTLTNVMRPIPLK